MKPGAQSFVFWGDKTAYYSGTSVDFGKEASNQNDVIVYLNKQIVIDVWNKYTDRNYNQAKIQSYVDSQNTIGQNLISQGKMIGWTMQFLPEDNPTPSEYLKFRLAILGPVGQSLTKFEIQVDLTALNSIFPA